VRHSDNHLAHFLSVESKTNVPVINAGDGSNEHPTQALLDLLIIKKHFPDFSKLTVAIVGDVAHSRVARSLMIGLQTMGIGKIRLITPKDFALDPTEIHHAEISHDIETGLHDVDVVYVLRIQKERMDPLQRPKDDLYFKQFGLTHERLALAKKSAIVMHAGPVNRGVEIESAVADGSQSVILQQTQHAVAVRMAIVESMLTVVR
jgi:aspartate carbamoyltransferase catalytic subunit